MIVDLASISPVSFLLAKCGDKLEITRKLPNKNEFRGNIGKATTMYLVCKGKTKIGIIPPSFIEAYETSYKDKHSCFIQSMDHTKKIITIKI
jgi:hypothetical protein